MKNTQIENILKAWEEGNFEDGLSEQGVRWCRRYQESKERGLDEIIIGYNEVVFYNDIEEMLEAARELKIKHFVFASGVSGAFNFIEKMTKHGARVGKFVVKEFEEKDYFGNMQTIQASGMRISL